MEIFIPFKEEIFANQAVAAAKLGGKVTFVCRVGDDYLGKNSIKKYETYDINTEFIGSNKMNILE